LPRVFFAALAIASARCNCLDRFSAIQFKADSHRRTAPAAARSFAVLSKDFHKHHRFVMMKLLMTRIHPEFSGV